MQMKHVSMLICVLMMAALSASAGGGSEQPAALRNTDKLFEEIMQSLPEEAKVQVDSASRVGAAMNLPSKTGSQTFSDDRKESKVKGLPEDVQKKVEKKIEEIESRREERALQFKEKKKSGK